MKANHWSQRHYEMIGKAKTFTELLEVAHDILDSIKSPVSLVSGPISTGGHGSTQKNIESFYQQIVSIENRGERVFNQLPFEDKFLQLAKDYEGYCLPILEDFFLPIFKSGKIAKIWFIPGWETSTGAKWEYEVAGRLGIPRFFVNF